MTGTPEPRPRMLVVEDEPIVAADLERSLLDLGYEVCGIAETRATAVRLAERQQPDLVLMDIGLRGDADGIAAAEEIARRWQIPVVFVTAVGSGELLSRAQATAPYGYVIKPFRLSELGATVQIALRQHHVAKELFSEQAWLRTMIASLSDGVVATDSDGRVRYLNPAAESLTGWTIKDAFGKLIDEVIVLRTFAGEPVAVSQARKALSSQCAIRPERSCLVSKDGRNTPVETSASLILQSGRTVGAVSVLLEITERMRREREAAEHKDRLEEQVQATTEALGQTRAELRALSGHLMTVQEEERRRLARELHDDFSQRAALLQMQATRALDLLSGDKEEAERLLRQIREEIAALDSGLRNASHRLHPSVLEDLGLAAGLRSLIQDFRDAGGDASVRLLDNLPEVPLEAATALYRIAQESLRNAMKHAPGAPVRVTLGATKGELELTVEDAGPGFDLEQVRAKGGLGLLSMQERARLVGGTVLLRTRPSHGTTLTVRVPR